MLGKRVLVLSVASTLLFGASAFAATKTSDIVATVNGEKITKEALSKSLYDWYSPAGVQDLIMIRLVDQEAKKAGVVVTQEEVQSRLKKITEAMVPKGVTFDDYIRQAGRTPSYVFAMVRINVQAEKILRKNLKITPAELGKYRRAKHILIMTGAQDAKDKDARDKAAKEKIDGIAKDIKDKKITFEEAAAKYSEDAGSKTKGGDVGWFTKGRMVPEFESTAFSMKPGDISAPFKTAFGYHIVQLTATGDTATGKDKEELKEMLIQLSTDTRAVQVWVMGIRDKAKIVNDLGPKTVVQQKPITRAAGKGRLTPLSVQKAATTVAPPPAPPAPPAPSK
jgi:foldase protein PrsA